MPSNYYNNWYWHSDVNHNNRLIQVDYQKQSTSKAQKWMNPAVWVYSGGDTKEIEALDLKSCNRIIKHIEAKKDCNNQEHKLYSIKDRKKVLTKQTQRANMEDEVARPQASVHLEQVGYRGYNWIYTRSGRATLEIPRMVYEISNDDDV